MALTLNAAQKNISKVFDDKTKYIIPPYQRPYSWTKNECEELFEDLKTAYFENKKEGYFLGNLILSTTDENEYEVIDGQQRLTTFIMFLKVLYFYDNENNKLKNSIWIIDDRKDEIISQKVETNVFIEKDSNSFKEVLKKEYEYIEPKDKNDNFKNNIYFFFNTIKKFINDGNDIQDFIDFILYKVFLLPIHTTDDTSLKAREKALKIFETMNNRGMPLDDTDIFKSNLYYMSIRTNETENFIKLWKDFDEKCNEIDTTKDKKLKLRVFKIYSYIIRGKEGIKTPEVGLRDFFDKNDYSPFKIKNYKEILEDLNRIITAFQYFETEKWQEENLVAPWFQIIDLYSNNYPKDLLIVYIYLNLKDGLINIKELVSFSKSLIRYCYSIGATTNIKYYIYDLTVKVSYGTWQEYFNKEYICSSYFGMSYKGFALLGIYLNKNQKTLTNYSFIRLRDIVHHSSIVNFNFDYIGNSIPSNLTINEIKNGNLSKIEDLNILSSNSKNWKKEDTEKRIDLLMERYKKFFGGFDEN